MASFDDYDGRCERGATALDALAAPVGTTEGAVQADEGSGACEVKTTTDCGAPRSQASILTDIGKRHHLFHDEGGDAFARINVGGHAEVIAINSAAYRDCLAREFYLLTNKGAGRNSVIDAISTLTAIAKHDGPVEPVYLRVGTHGTSIVIDTGRDDWQCIEVTAGGWRMTTDRIVNFRRSGKLAPLPVPTVADFSKLWKFVNVAPCDRALVAAWLIGALRPSGPYPILLLVGEQGTGKSCASRTLKRLTDPSAVLLRAPPRDEKDLLVAALSSWVLALDNLSGAKPELSDALCRIATGGGLAGRTLYTNADETLIEVKRPVILNGIDDLASRPDLSERCLHFELPPLGTRTTEAALEKAFAEDAGAIFAAVLDGLALALRDQHILREGLPRMADFAQFAAAGVPALGYTADEFLDAYRANQAKAIEAGLETSAFAAALRSFMARRASWTGSAMDLLSALGHQAGDLDRSATSWPRTAKGVVTTLRRLAPSLRHAGIEYMHSRSSTERFITVTCKQREQASQASPASHAWVSDDAMTLMTLAIPPRVPNETAVVEGDV